MLEAGDGIVNQTFKKVIQSCNPYLLYIYGLYIYDVYHSHEIPVIGHGIHYFTSIIYFHLNLAKN